MLSLTLEVAMQVKFAALPAIGLVVAMAFTGGSARAAEVVAIKGGERSNWVIYFLW
jgi:hypothetical protein